MTPQRWDYDWLPIYFVSLLLVAFLLVIAAIGNEKATPRVPAAAAVLPTPSVNDPGAAAEDVAPPVPARIFDGHRLLVAYYGTAGTGSLGVLGEGSPEEIMPRLVRAARAYAVTGRPVQPVFELIVTVAHAGPTRSGQYSSDIDRAGV
ncbi:MAG: hypothetical protein NTV23_14000 [Propionibacteriales bacterium]|nr:hypothetical protein [Propionibacteriales bacterium]